MNKKTITNIAAKATQIQLMALNWGSVIFRILNAAAVLLVLKPYLSPFSKGVIVFPVVCYVFNPIAIEVWKYSLRK